MLEYVTSWLPPSGVAILPSPLPPKTNTLTCTHSPTHSHALIPQHTQGVSLAKGDVTNYYSANGALEDADRSQAVCCMCWEHEYKEGLLYCGLRNGLVQQFGAQEGIYQAECDCTGGAEAGTFVGLGKHEE